MTKLRPQPEYTLESIGHNVETILEDNKEIRDCLFGNGDVGLKIKVDRLVQTGKTWSSLRIGTIMAVVATAIQLGFKWKWGN